MFRSHPAPFVELFAAVWLHTTSNRCEKLADRLLMHMSLYVCFAMYRRMSSASCSCICISVLAMRFARGAIRTRGCRTFTIRAGWTVFPRIIWTRECHERGDMIGGYSPPLARSLL
ncbi:hypothetical protein BV20DRAFT_464962 [Pilatotrama ljubarskyi]|nr:hypothetical protein BV20DRAFT_464962 [Pilatotrama ljubarskyi]